MKARGIYSSRSAITTSSSGGAQATLAEPSASGQRARGHDVLAISLAPPPDGPLAGSGVETRTVPKRGPTVDPLLPRRLAAVLRRRGVSIVHTHNPQPLIYAGVAGRLAGAAVVQTRHGVAFRGRRQAWLLRRMARFADAQVLVSRELESALGFETTPVIDNGIDVELYRPDASDRAVVRREMGIAGDAMLGGSVSRLIASKNVTGLVRAALPILCEKVQLAIVGDGPEAKNLEHIVAGDRRGRFVRLFGERADVPRLLLAFDVFALFSRTEDNLWPSSKRWPAPYPWWPPTSAVSPAS
jgi:glycosyltransferase involved in cell wall biosynthesis